MYKSIIKFCAIGLVALSWQACSGVDYDGEYSKDGTFEGMNQVYFDLSNEADTLYSYSFGTTNQRYYRHSEGKGKNCWCKKVGNTTI